MPLSVGLFDDFDNLDQISLEAIAAQLKPVPQFINLENYLANRILYPQTLSQTAYDMQIDLAILREAVKMNYSKIEQKVNARKLLIPARLLNFVPDLISLTNVFIDALLFNRKMQDPLQDLWTIVLTDHSDEVVGSILLPQLVSGGIMEVNSLGKIYEIKQGQMIIVPCPKDRSEIAYKVKNGQALGKTESAVEIAGGKLGLVVDGRGI